jgi:hypothetical protein
MSNSFRKTPPEVPAVEADLLGEAVLLKPPAVPLVETGNSEPNEKNEAVPASAEDENKTGFIGKRNLPHP